MDQPEKQIGILLTRVSNQNAENFTSLLKPFGLSPEQFNVLRILRGKKGESAGVMEIQEKMITKNSNATRLVEKLQQKGLVHREICPENRRKMNVTITDNGLKLLKETDLLVELHHQKLTQDLDENQKLTLIKILEKLLK